MPDWRRPCVDFSFARNQDRKLDKARLKTALSFLGILNGRPEIAAGRFKADRLESAIFSHTG